MFAIEFGRLVHGLSGLRQLSTAAEFESFVDAETKMFVDGRLFYEEPYFAIFEFALQAVAFLDADRGDWKYDADGMSQNPTLSLTETATGALSIASPFQMFEAATPLPRGDIKRVLIDFKTRLLRAALDELGLDANWIFAR